MLSFYAMNGMMGQVRNSRCLECALLLDQLKGDVFAWSSESEGTKPNVGMMIIGDNRGRRRLSRTKRWI